MCLTVSHLPPLILVGRLSVTCRDGLLATVLMCFFCCYNLAKSGKAKTDRLLALHGMKTLLKIQSIYHIAGPLIFLISSAKR